MITERVLEILKLPRTAVIGKITTAYNPYTLFIPFKPQCRYDFLLVTELPEFAKRRISLYVPYTPAEEELCTRLLQKKQVFALQSAALPGMTVIPDSTTRLITHKTVREYPFKTMYIPKGVLLTPAAREENLIIKEESLCNSEQFAEVFGQPRNQMP